MGIPYSMAGRDWDDVAFANALKNKIITSKYMKGYYDGRVDTTAHGVDCSKFIYYALKAANTSVTLSPGLTTSSIPTCGKFRKLKSLDSMLPGDIINNKGSHVLLFVGKSKGDYHVFEASGGASRCIYKIYSRDDLKSYTPYRFRGFE